MEGLGSLIHEKYENKLHKNYKYNPSLNNIEKVINLGELQIY